MTLSFRADPKRAKLLPMQVDAPDIVEWLLNRDPQAVGAWNELGREEYGRAFTAAQTAGLDVIDDLYFGLVDNVARRGTETDFAQLVTPILKAKGWLGGDAQAIGHRVRLIYDTQLRLSRAAGRWTHYQAGKFAAPYVRGVTVGDERVRHPPKSKHADHRAFDGIVLPLDHPFVAEYWTPLGFRCRCLWVQMTRSDLARWGDGITSEEDLARRRALIGPPVFPSPALPIREQLAAMVSATNDGPRMPGAPRVDPVRTAKEGGDAFDAVLRAASLKDLGRQLAAIGF